jgi:hypothetical protein
MITLKRLGLWFGSLLLSATLFVVLFSVLFRASAILILRVTMIFAFPLWCLYLPLVIALKDVKERRIWIILLSGTLIAPASLALRGLMLQLRGGDPHEIWYGDPLIGLGGFAAMIFAFIVGFVTTSFYVIALRIVHRRSTAAKG